MSKEDYSVIKCQPDLDRRKKEVSLGVELDYEKSPYP